VATKAQFDVDANVTGDDDLEGLADALDKVDIAAEQAKEELEKLSKLGGKLQTLGSGITRIGAGLTAAITVPITALGAAALKMGAEAVESENLFSVSFGDMADSARDWSVELSSALGLNEFELRKQAGVIFTMTDSMGLSRDAAFGMATGITELANDMASFFNLRPEEAFEKLQAGITGEAEPLKRLGILVGENFVKQGEFAQAILATGRSLTEQEKVQARYIAILEQTGNAQGDLARTMDSPINAIRILKTRMEETITTLGISLLPIIQQIIPVVVSMVDAFEKAVDMFVNLSPAMQKVVVAVALIAAAIPVMITGLGLAIAAVGQVIISLSAMGVTGAGLVAGLVALKAIAIGVGSAILGMASALAAPIAVLVGVGVAANALGTALNEGAAASRGYSDATDEAIERVGLFRAGLDLLPDLLSGLKRLGGEVFEGFVALPGLFIDWFNSLGPVQGAISAVSVVLEALGPVGEFIIAVFEKIKAVISGVFAAIGPAIASAQKEAERLAAKYIFLKKDALDPLGDATRAQQVALEEFIKSQKNGTTATVELGTAVKKLSKEEMAALIKAEMAAAKEAEAFEKKIDTLAAKLGGAGLTAKMNDTTLAIQRLGGVSKLSVSGLESLDGMIKQLRKDSQELTPELKAVALELSKLALTKALDNMTFEVPLESAEDFQKTLEEMEGEFTQVGVAGVTVTKGIGDGFEEAEAEVFDFNGAMDSVNDVLSEARGFMNLFGIEADSAFGKIIGKPRDCSIRSIRFWALATNSSGCSGVRAACPASSVVSSVEVVEVAEVVRGSPRRRSASGALLGSVQRSERSGWAVGSRLAAVELRRRLVAARQEPEEV